MNAGGAEWRVDQVVSVTDGDTLRVYRSRVEQIGDDWYRIQDVNPDGTPRSVPIRLVWVDTPESGDHPGWENARFDLVHWVHAIASMTSPLRAICYESAGWDRQLGDLIDADGNSASQWLMTVKGWPPYVKKKR